MSIIIIFLWFLFIIMFVGIMHHIEETMSPEERAGSGFLKLLVVILSFFITGIVLMYISDEYLGGFS